MTKENEEYSKKCEVLLRKFLTESDSFMLSNANIQISIEDDIADYFKENSYYDYLWRDKASWRALSVGWALNAVALQVLSNMTAEVFQGRLGKFKIVETYKFFIAMEVEEVKERKE